jgi:hypothetical protein
MSYAKKNQRNVVGGLLLMGSTLALAAWQFYRFATFRDAGGVVNVEGGGIHFWLGLLMLAFTCGIGFLIASVFLRHDTDDELHITSAPGAPALKPSRLK